MYIDDTSVETFRSLLAVNLVGYFLFSKVRIYQFMLCKLLNIHVYELLTIASKLMDTLNV